ncbi:MAG: DUF3185 family protein [Phycisphaerales bacterium]
MPLQRIIGIILTIAGVGLLIVGLNAKDSVADRFSNFFTGHFTDSTVLYLIGGAVVALTGLPMIIFGGQKRAR